jgi:hypothetical protein
MKDHYCRMTVPMPVTRNFVYAQNSLCNSVSFIPVCGNCHTNSPMFIALCHVTCRWKHRRCVPPAVRAHHQVNRVTLETAHRFAHATKQVCVLAFLSYSMEDKSFLTCSASTQTGMFITANTTVRIWTPHITGHFTLLCHVSLDLSASCFFQDFLRKFCTQFSSLSQVYYKPAGITPFIWSPQ